MNNNIINRYAKKIILSCEAFRDNESPFIETLEIQKKLIGNKKIIVNSINMDQKLINPEYFELLDVRNERNYEYLNLEEVSLSKSKFCNEASYIGILINSFKFFVFKEEVFFASTDNEMIIDNFINQIENLLKDKPFKCSSSAFAYIDQKNPHYIKAGMDKKYVIHYNFEVNFNKKTKLLILEKIFNVFYETITTKYDNEKIINDLLVDFAEVSRDVKDLFNERKNINSDRCACTNCLIF